MAVVAYIIIFSLLFALSAAFSCSETALVSLSHYRLKKLMLKKKPLAVMFKEWLSAPHIILSTILIGNNAVNIAITTIATAAAVSIFAGFDQRVVEAGVWLFLMVFILVLGEITPKIFARRYPEAISLFAILPLYYLSALMKPFINLSTYLIKPFSFGARISPVKNVTSISVEEIRRLIKESGDSGYLAKTSTDMMQRVLMLHEINVNGIMTRIEDVESIDISSLKNKGRDFMDEINEIGHSRIPVVKGDKTNVVGYINVKDTYIPAVKGETLDLEAFIRKPVFVKHTVKVADLIREFKSSGTLIAVVKDDLAKACGVVTIKDILKEIVGEIIEEYDSIG